MKHCFLRYPEESEVSLGERRGCYETPSAEVPPKQVICEDIAGLSKRQSNPALMHDPDPTKHPDSDNQNRCKRCKRVRNTPSGEDCK